MSEHSSLGPGQCGADRAVFERVWRRVMPEDRGELMGIAMLWVIVIACLIVGFGGSLPAAVGNLWENTQSFFSYPGPSGWTPYAARFGYPFSCAIGWTAMLLFEIPYYVYTCRKRGLAR